MNPLILVSLAFAPGVFWLWQIYRRQRARPDPRNLVIRTFLLGAAAAIPIAMFEGAIWPANVETSNSAAAAFYVAFIVAGVTEEVGKFLIVRWTLFDSPYFDEPMSGLIFASSVALGFSSLENAFYMYQFGAAVIVNRAIFAALGHVVFSALWGYPLGWRKQHSTQGRPASGIPVILGVVAAAALHGSFDFFLMKPNPSGGAASAVFAVGLVVFLLLMHRANRVSPFRNLISRPLLACSRCATLNVRGSASCSECGSALGSSVDQVLCEKCRTPLRRDANFCTQCGCRLIGQGR